MELTAESQKPIPQKVTNHESLLLKIGESRPTYLPEVEAAEELHGVLGEWRGGGGQHLDPVQAQVLLDFGEHCLVGHHVPPRRQPLARHQPPAVLQTDPLRPGHEHLRSGGDYRVTRGVFFGGAHFKLKLLNFNYQLPFWRSRV